MAMIVMVYCGMQEESACAWELMQVFMCERRGAWARGLEDVRVDEHAGWHAAWCDGASVT